jgi:hypothetical protein
MNFGAKLFPTNDEADDRCWVVPGVEVAPAPNNSANLLASIPGRNDAVNGATPAESGYRIGADWLEANYPNDTNAVIFILDGAISDGRQLMGVWYAIDCGLPGNGDFDAPTENDVDTLTDAIDEKFLAGIPTFVVGIDIDNGLDPEMNGYAQAGGFPLGGQQKYYSTSSQSALLGALNNIVGNVAPCEVSLSVPAPSNVTVEVTINGVMYTEITEAECNMGSTGWYYSDAPTNTTMKFCGNACDEFLAVGTSTVEFFCSAG